MAWEQKRSMLNNILEHGKLISVCFTSITERKRVFMSDNVQFCTLHSTRIVIETKKNKKKLKNEGWIDQNMFIQNSCFFFFIFMCREILPFMLYDAQSLYKSFIYRLLYVDVEVSIVWYWVVRRKKNHTDIVHLNDR